MSLRKFRVSFVVLLLAVLILSLSGIDKSWAQEKLTIWTKFNADNPQVASDRWLQQAIAAYQTEKGVALENTYIVYSEINTRLNVAVQAGGTVPDVAYIDSQSLGLFNNNETLVDLTEWVKAAAWYSDLDPAALAACTTPDGKILCVPSSVTSHLSYYWKDLYPDGYPATTDEMLAAAPPLKDAGKYAITFKGAEGASVERFYGPLILSFGGTLVGENGTATWANEGAVKAVQFARELIQNGYAPQVVLTTGFDFEEPFKRGEAGGFVAGSYSYVYLTPLTAPSGETFDQAPPAEGFDKNAIAVGAAGDAGELGFAPALSAPGGKPTSLVIATAWAIPYGSGNEEGAKAFIDWQMQTPKNIEFAVGYGSLPSLLSAAKDEAFAAPYWQAVSKFKEETGVPAPGWTNYDQAIDLLSKAIVACVSDPNVDILTQLQKAQDEYNASLD
ncbi:MAG: extracellular solute-binding protein [Anaerolineae bacterium]|nr:extracellular solute-binding protein [Anaerolineae bacterium]